jgi:microcystin-dependent protein
MKELIECLQKNPATTAIIIIALVVFIYMLYIKKENITVPETMTSLSNEAVQNISSVYSETNKTITMNNLNVSGNLSVSGNVNFTQFKGIIVAWSGSTATIPTGWGLCDGTLYTALDGTKLQSPDLRSKFIVGASSPGTPTNNVGPTAGNRGTPNYPGMWLSPREVGTYGGEENHTLQLNEINHSHANIGGTVIGAGGPLGVGAVTGTPSPHNNMPPYFALAYIIKL